MPNTTCVAIVVAEPSSEQREIAAVAGFLAGYCGSTRRSYATDLRLFARWCHEGHLTLFTVRRAHLELYGRWLEETGRMRSTVARRLSTLASLYRYLAEEEYIDRNPAVNVRRPKVDYESRTLGLDRNELGAFLVQAGIGCPRPCPGVIALAQRAADLLSARGEHRRPRLRTGTSDPQDRSQGRQTGHYPAGPPEPPGCSTFTSMSGPPARFSSAPTGTAWTATPRTAW